MKTVHVILNIVLVGLFLIGCTQSVTAPETKNPANQEIVFRNLQPSLTYKKENGKLLFLFEIKNQNDQLEILTFSNGMEYEYTLTSEAGEITKSADGNMSTQDYFVKSLKQGKSLSYWFSLDDLKKGRYTLQCQLLAKSQEDLIASVQFEVED